MKFFQELLYHLLIFWPRLIWEHNLDIFGVLPASLMVCTDLWGLCFLGASEDYSCSHCLFIILVYMGINPFGSLHLIIQTFFDSFFFNIKVCI